MEGSSGPPRSNERRAEPPTLSRELIPEQVMVEAREELRGAMKQYTSCPDPTESAARMERLRQAEEEGDVEKSTEQIARQLMRDQRVITDPVLPEPTKSRVPISQRLGGIPHAEEQDEGTREKERVPAKKRLGRPPANKHLGVNISVAGSSGVAKKRRVAQEKSGNGGREQ
ncbi:unnamed protein product [Eruca vesicaria subsp. sativa]|uniref:Uncharacterized protein n=1 Tax=Eruca vesicaria subsp. sativa TaxID=29727 RepID=A0ABC8J122_ERUVS|nr:unnamed protein product [Eruca vesicaria subsp. sativa]